MKHPEDWLDLSFIWMCLKSILSEVTLVFLLKNKHERRKEFSLFPKKPKTTEFTSEFTLKQDQMKNPNPEKYIRVETYIHHQS